MSRAFSPRPFTPPEISIVNADKPAGTFWTRAQNLNRYEQSIRSFGSTQAFGGKLCGFCQACFKDVPTNGETKRTQHRSGLYGLCRSAKYCPLCAFYSKLILRRRGDATFQNNHMLIVYTRNTHSQPGSAYPVMNVGLEIKSHCMFAMAFCPDLNKISKREIWNTKQPEFRSRVRLFRKWLKKCEKGHPKCSQHGVHGQPSRLLQIDTSARSNFARLTTLSTTSVPVRYAALSHCWGLPDSVFSTTTSNLKQLHSSIPMEQLPKNFLDAIQITKALGLTYLWIDSLCIVQDSPTDWAIESAKMNVVYLNAVVTIAASSSNDAHGGCFLNLQHPPSLRLRLPISNTGSNVGQRVLKGTLRSTYASPFTVSDSPINKRGWVFQEMVLSSRVLHFTEEQVYWQCREVVESED
ncbi:HET-domain-containing protein, partial [Periconia macrospinosa]